MHLLFQIPLRIYLLHLQQLIRASCEKCMVTNIDKTFYLHLSKNPVRLPIYLPGNQTVHHTDNGEHLYLGRLLTTSNDTMQHIKCKLKHRAFNIVKFYPWLDINEDTPIQINTQVLDSCILVAYLYGCECWWKIDLLASSILAEERRILKRILQVKSNTANDIIYVELNRCDVASKMKSRQCKFYHEKS